MEKKSFCIDCIGRCSGGSCAGAASTVRLGPSRSRSRRRARRCNALTTAHGTFTTTATRLDARHILGAKALVGIAPHRSSTWTGPTSSLATWERLVGIAVHWIEKVDDLPQLQGLPFMARSAVELSEVARPLLMTATPALDLPTDARDEVLEAAELLERVSFEVGPAAAPHAFRVEIALDGVDALTAVGCLTQAGGEVRLSFAELRHVDPQTGPSVANCGDPVPAPGGVLWALRGGSVNGG